MHGDKLGRESRMSCAMNCNGCIAEHSCAVSYLDTMLSMDDGIPPEHRFASRHYRSGEFIFHQGQASTYLWMVCNGLVMQVIVNQQGEELCVRLVGPGAFLGLSDWLQRASTYSASAKAVTNGVVTGLRPELAHGWFLRDPRGTTVLLEQLGAHIHSLESAAVGLRSSDAAGRVVHCLLQLARWFHLDGQETICFPVTIPRWAIAKVTGLRPETVSRVMGRLVSAHLLTYRECRLTIPNLPRLTQAFGSGLTT